MIPTLKEMVLVVSTSEDRILEPTAAAEAAKIEQICC